MEMAFFGVTLWCDMITREDLALPNTKKSGCFRVWVAAANLRSGQRQRRHRPEKTRPVGPRCVTMGERPQRRRRGPRP
jgi:hypothetical protein